jgi:hypothetical protein
MLKAKANTTDSLRTRDDRLESLPGYEFLAAVVVDLIRDNPTVK